MIYITGRSSEFSAASLYLRLENIYAFIKLVIVIYERSGTSLGGASEKEYNPKSNIFNRAFKEPCDQ